MQGIPSVRDSRSVESFIRWCINHIGLGYHPDTPFADYRDRSGLPLFTDQEATKLDELTDSAFSISGDNVYEMGMQEFRRLSGLV